MYQPVAWEGNKATIFVYHIFITHLPGNETNSEIYTTQFILTNCLERQHCQIFKQYTKQITVSRL